MQININCHRVFIISLFQLIFTDFWLLNNLFTEKTSSQFSKTLSSHYKTLQLAYIWKYISHLLMWKAKTSSKIRINFYRRQYLLKLLSWTKFPLNNRQSSKALKFNCRPSKLEKTIINRQLPLYSDPPTWQIFWSPSKCRVAQKLRNSNALYHKTKCSLGVKLCVNISFYLL